MTIDDQIAALERIPDQSAAIKAAIRTLHWLKSNQDWIKAEDAYRRAALARAMSDPDYAGFVERNPGTRASIGRLPAKTDECCENSFTWNTDPDADA